MLVILDTNVVFSGLWQPAGPSARVLQSVRSGAIVPVFDSRIWDEYSDVLGRPKFLARCRGGAILLALSSIRRLGLDAGDVPPYRGQMPDEADRAFFEVALANGAALVTGNVRDYPTDAGVEVMTPAEAVRRLLGG
jgi:putative PIN family toxin of toxin-antitoxin system